LHQIKKLYYNYLIISRALHTNRLKIKWEEIMAKEIILYNLREDVTDEDYAEWCKSYKGPFLLGLDSVKRFTLVGMIGGIKGNGSKGMAPEQTPPPYKYIGILDCTDLEALKKDGESKTFKEEFFSQWFSKWVGDFYVLVGMEVFDGKSQ